MVERMYKKGLVIGIIILFFGVGVQSTSANDVSEIKETTEEDSLPDLIVEDITYYDFESGWNFYYVDVHILNQGDAVAYGNVTLEFTAVRTLFWLFNIRIVYEYKDTLNLRDGLAPGETTWDSVSQGDFTLPIFGLFYKFNAGINLDKKIDESNYNNNEGYELVLCILTSWI